MRRNKRIEVVGVWEWITIISILGLWAVFVLWFLC